MFQPGRGRCRQWSAAPLTSSLSPSTTSTMPAKAHRPAMVRTHTRSSSGGSSKPGLNLQFTQKEPPPARVADKAKKSGHYHHEVRPRPARDDLRPDDVLMAPSSLPAMYSPRRAPPAPSSCGPTAGSACTQGRTLRRPYVGPPPPIPPRNRTGPNRSPTFLYQVLTKARTTMNGCLAKAVLQRRTRRPTRRTLRLNRHPSELRPSPRLLNSPSRLS